MLCIRKYLLVCCRLTCFCVCVCVNFLCEIFSCELILGQLVLNFHYFLLKFCCGVAPWLTFTYLLGWLGIHINDLLCTKVARKCSAMFASAQSVNLTYACLSLLHVPEFVEIRLCSKISGLELFLFYSISIFEIILQLL